MRSEPKWPFGGIIQDKVILQIRAIRMRNWEKSSSLYFSFSDHEKEGMEIQ